MTMLQPFARVFPVGILGLMLNLLPQGALAQNELSCDRIVSELASQPTADPTQPAPPSLIGGLAEIFKSMIATEEEETEERIRVETDPYYMTTTNGNALFLDCSTSSGLQKLSFFPVGMVVKSKFAFTYDDDAYVMGQTEHGLHLIFDRNWLLEIGPDDIFFVWDGFGDMPLCGGGEYSAGTCNPFARTAADGPKLQSWSGRWTGFVHARFEDLDDTFDVTKTYLEWLRQQSEDLRVKLENPFLKQESVDEHFRAYFVSDTKEWREFRRYYCNPFNAGAVYQNGSVPGDEPAWPNVTLSLCEDRRETPGSAIPEPDAADTFGPRPVKIITREAAQQIDRSAASIVFPNASDLSLKVMIEAQALPSRLSLQASLYTKACRETLQDKWNHQKSGLASAGVEVGAFAAKVQTMLDSNRAISENYGSDEMFHTTAVIEFQQSGTLGLNEINDIRMIANCIEDVPDKLRTIIFEHPDMERDQLEIAADQLLAIYGEIAEQRAGVAEDYGVQSDSSRASMALGGVFWQIKDPNEYLIWRATLREFLSRERSVTSKFYGASVGDQRERMQAVDHFAHMLMAAIFRSNYEASSVRVEVPDVPDFN